MLPSAWELALTSILGFPPNADAHCTFDGMRFFLCQSDFTFRENR